MRSWEQRFRRLTACAAVIALAVVLSCAPVQADRPAATPGQRPAPSEKDARTPAQKKIDSQLLYEIYRLRGQAKEKNVPEGPTGVRLDASHRALVDVRAEVSPVLERRVRALGAAIVSTDAKYRTVIAWVPLKQLERLAGDRAVYAIVPAAQAAIRNDPSTSFTR